MSIGLRMAGVLSQRRVLHPMTYDYISRLQAVDGHEPAFDAANDYLIRELVALGGAYWDTMGTLTTLVGKKFTGLLVPLRNGMNVGTPFEFVAGDFDAKTGLVGDGSSKYIDSNRTTSVDGMTDNSFGVWIHTPASGEAQAYMGGQTPGDNMILHINSTTRSARVRSVGVAASSFTSINPAGYFGASRSNADNFNVRDNKFTFTTSLAVVAFADGVNHHVFRRNQASSFIPTAARLSIYHIGPALNLTTLDGILTEYMARIAAVTL